MNAPSHYRSDPSGVECLTITRHRTFNIGNAIKYLWRAGLKGDRATEVEDLRKAVFYIEDEIRRLSPAPFLSDAVDDYEKVTEYAMLSRMCRCAAWSEGECACGYYGSTTSNGADT